MEREKNKTDLYELFQKCHHDHPCSIQYHQISESNIRWFDCHYIKQPWWWLPIVLTFLYIIHTDIVRPTFCVWLNINRILWKSDQGRRFKLQWYEAPSAFFQLNDKHNTGHYATKKENDLNRTMHNGHSKTWLYTFSSIFFECLILSSVFFLHWKCCFDCLFLCCLILFSIG